MLNLAQPGEDVFPAHAGMSRGDSPRRRTTTSFPRTRGDEPARRNQARNHVLFSPHTRG